MPRSQSWSVTDERGPLLQRGPGRPVRAGGLHLRSGSGVFSRGHLDHATAVLFREMEPPAQGQFLDLGCGYGVIGLALAKAVPLGTVTGVAVHERGLARE